MPWLEKKTLGYGPTMTIAAAFLASVTAWIARPEKTSINQHFAKDIAG
ncbi:hypothetical protein [Phreatobacter sp.]|nr:hypothetical protein [Phreatobacter sp.]MCZ8313477.1 hypothetical protein [Phreatobacter sp.]